MPGKVTVTAFVNGWCLAMNLTYEQAKRAATEFGDQVVFREIDTSERATIAEWGISDAVYVDHKEIGGGIPALFPFAEPQIFAIQLHVIRPAPLAGDQIEMVLDERLPARDSQQRRRKLNGYKGSMLKRPSSAWRD